MNFLINIAAILWPFLALPWGYFCYKHAHPFMSGVMFGQTIQFLVFPFSKAIVDVYQHWKIKRFLKKSKKDNFKKDNFMEVSCQLYNQYYEHLLGEYYENLKKTQGEENDI